MSDRHHLAMPAKKSDSQEFPKCVGAESRDTWLPFHLYYHEDLERATREFLLPVVDTLARKGWVRGFHFLRYSLGGPHLRVRFCVPSSHREEVEVQVLEEGRRFLGRRPSERSISEEAIAGWNQEILAGDANEHDATAYVDNTLRIESFRPEVDRYGGPDLIQHSLDFFTLSSLAALEFRVHYGQMPRSSQLAHIVQLLVRQAFGLASSPEELTRIFRYGLDAWGEQTPSIVEKGRRIAEAQGDFLVGLLSETRDQVLEVHRDFSTSPRLADFLTLGARALSEVIPQEDSRRRNRVWTSQQHMTAARLGLSNVEEVYMSSLMTSTLERVLGEALVDFDFLEKPARANPRDSPTEIPQLVQSALSSFSRIYATASDREVSASTAGV